MTSLLAVTFTWTGTPTGMAGISTRGPPNVPFGCTPVNPYQYFTFAWSQFGNGCPNEYSYNSVATTCVYTADLYNSQTWGCTWTTSVVATSTVDGGLTTAPAGVPATVTGPIQWVTVTSTQQTTTTSTSIVDPGAKTVTVTATQGSKLRRGESPREEIRSGEENIPGYLNSEKPLGGRPTDDLVLAAFNPAAGTNSTGPLLEDRALCPYTDQIWCGAGCCLDTQSCVGNGAVSCCNGYDCVPFDANAPFVDYISWSWNGFTRTSTIFSTVTSYSTINPPGNTMTIFPTSTTNINVFQTKVVTAVVTSTGATVTVTNLVGTASDALSQGVGAGASGGQVTVTVGAQSSASIISSGGGHSSSNLGLKVGVGVGIPIALAILAALLFLLFRRRKKTDSNPSTNPETSANNPNAGAVGGRPVSELPPYTANALAAAGLARKPVGGVSSAPVSPGSDLPERHYSANGFYPSPSQSPPPGQGTYRSQAGSPPPQSVYTAQSSPPTQHQQMSQVYVPPTGYEGQEMYAPQPPLHQRHGSMGYPPQNIQGNAGYPPLNPQANMGYQAQPEGMGYHAQPGHEMYVPEENEGSIGYQAMPGQTGGIRYVNEAETRANIHEM